MWVHLLLFSALTGTVLDEKSRPIEGAVVVLLPSGFGKEPATTKSDAAGRFELALPKLGPFHVEAYASGYAPFRARDVSPEKPLEIILRRGGESIQGFVRDGETLEPIEGAVVETRAGEGAARVAAMPRLGLVEAVTDERGEFRLEGLTKVPYWVSASAPGYGRTTRQSTSPGERVEIYLFPGSGIYGRLLDEKGVPIDGAFVFAEPDERLWRSGPITPQASDADGRFAFLGLEPGRYRLFARGEGFAPAVDEVELGKESDAEIELVLTRGVTLFGRLIDENDNPAAGKVSLRALDGSAAGPLFQSRFAAETDAEGSFSLGPVPSGEHTLLVEARGYGSRNIDVSVSGRAPQQDLGDIVLETGLTISGRVVDESGTPVVSASVSSSQPARGMMSASGELFVTAETDGEGRFVLAGLSPGAQHVNASAPGYGYSESVLVEPGASGVTLALKRAGSIRGAVVDPEGGPVTSFRVMGRSAERGRGTRMVTVQDAEGVFVLESVVEGEYALEITSQDFLPEVVSGVRVSAGNLTEVGTVRLRRGGTIVGTVVNSSAEPVPGATIQAFTPGQRRFQMMESDTSSDRQGPFQIHGLADGKVTVMARHPGYAEAGLEGVEVDSRSGASEIEIVMSRGGALEGIVRTRDGTDVAGRTIQVFAPGTPSRSDAVRTFEDGSFRIEHLPSGKLIAALQHTEASATFTVQTREVEIVEGETTYVEFHPRRIVVQGQARRALSAVEIELWPTGAGFTAMYGGVEPGGPPSSGPRYLMGMSGEDGYFEILVGEPGEYHVSASGYGVGLPSRTVTIPDVEVLSMDLDFGGATVSGRVVDRETEAPVSEAFVLAAPTNQSMSSMEAEVQAGPDGFFELALEPGEFTLVVRAEGYATAEKKIAVAETGRSDLLFALSPGLRITGRVLDASGRGVGSLRVWSVVDSPDISTPPLRIGVARTISDGSFLVDELARGRYNVLAGGGDVGFAFLPSIDSGTEDLQMVLRPGGKIEVLVVDSQGAPVPQAIVAVAAIDGRKIRGVQGSADERGRLQLMAPRGNLTIKAALLNGPEGLAAVSLSENGIARVQVVLREPVQGVRNR
jgi:hypothetical protein